MDSSILLVIYN